VTQVLAQAHRSRILPPRAPDLTAQRRHSAGGLAHRSAAVTN
jgi:hypothetical protein